MATLRVKATLPAGRKHDITARNEAVLALASDVSVSDRTVLATFRVKRDSDAFETWVKSLPAGTLVSVHRCTADGPPEGWYNCKDDPAAQYREMTV